MYEQTRISIVAMFVIIAGMYCIGSGSAFEVGGDVIQVETPKEVSINGEIYYLDGIMYSLDEREFYEAVCSIEDKIGMSDRIEFRVVDEVQDPMSTDRNDTIKVIEMEIVYSGDEIDGNEWVQEEINRINSSFGGCEFCDFCD